MLKENSVLRLEARNALSQQWLVAALAALVFSAVLGVPASIPFAGTIVCILVLPINYGFAVLFLKRLRGEELNIGSLFDGFNDYGRILGTALLQAVYTFLWSLLLVIPGIVKSYSYAMTNYILLDEPELRYDAAIEKSMKLMAGNKMKLFLLDLSFIGWALLCVLTFGIGLFWLKPYVSTAHAAFYEDIKNNLQVAA
ncbi:DUF975 family protein [Bacteroides sp.]|uniref:DUF975 family protein n=1 Tax=Bacteroides sp. TaxID=29523 RepID=UPI001B3EE7A5|nr:DUF975 family protein [Bacteroides sp.]MBP6067888.1 DUF975 family protein [Bacteroides sp.]MBP6936926.1 DUF975 family protein [Bacteroides sp.]MBP9585801.1 DUF975 family protein [Bacteroides sp.]